MDHQSELEKSKYRNWVRGGLAYKYLKEGLEGFADEVVLREHERIITSITYKPGLICNECSIRCLRPIHGSKRNPVTGHNECPYGQKNCNCLYSKKQKCRYQICDNIMEDVLKSHGSTPPTPNWKNTDIQSWCSSPWAIAKCFINAPGYSDITKASEMDAPGLLHIFINNKKLHSYVSCELTEKEIFSKTLKRRNTMFHSPKLELGDNELNDCIDNIIAILEDPKELSERYDSQQAVLKLKELKQKSFIVTTHTEGEVCRAAIKSVTDKLAELRQMIQDASDDIKTKQSEMSKHTDDKTQKQTIEVLNERITQAELDIAVIKKRLTENEGYVDKLNAAHNSHEKRLEYVEGKRVLRGKLMALYSRHYVKSWLSPLNVQNNDININDVYVTPNMVVEEKADPKTEKETRMLNALNSRDGKQALDDSMALTDDLRTISRYRDIFQTGTMRHKKIYIVGEIGTGKSSFCKMMIYNWCRASKDGKQDSSYDENVDEMNNFDFLFFIPLQRMSGFNNDIIEMIQTFYKHLTSTKLIMRIFEQESESCLIIADGLDEWTPSKDAPIPQHVSYGIPVNDGIQNATLITLCRPSAKGILNLTSSESDQNIELLGIIATSTEEFTRKYMSRLNQNEECVSGFMEKIKLAKLQPIEKTPMLLQQLIWVYCTGNYIGKTISDIFSNILNIMFCWYENKKGSDTKYIHDIPKEFEQRELPELIARFPRCEENKRYILLLSKLSYEMVSENLTAGVFSRVKLQKCGLTRDDIETLIRFGILAEYNSFDRNYEKTYLSFIHSSYLEFFAAVYISIYSGAVQTNKQHSILEELLMHFRSTADIIQLSNLLKMVCGLTPNIVEEMSKVIANNLICDINMTSYRNNIQTYEHLGNAEPEKIQDLMQHCLSESGNEDQTVISLCDIVVGKEVSMHFFQKISPNNVCSLCFCENFTPDEQILKWTALLCQLQFLCIEIDAISPEMCAHLNSTLTHTISLKHFALKSHRLTPLNYTIDLSNNHLLQSIYSEKCVCYVVNSTNLETVSLINEQCAEHEACEKFAVFLSNAVSLKNLKLKGIKCALTGCKGHAIDVDKHDKLQHIHLEHSSFILRSEINADDCQHLCVSGGRYAKVNHERCNQLASSLTRAISLRQITLKNIRCTHDDFHQINLSEHEQLQTIHIESVSLILNSAINVNSLQSVYISDLVNAKGYNGTCEHLASTLKQALSLKRLTLIGITCSCISRHTIDLSNLGALQRLTLIRCMHVSSVNTNNLETLHISQPSSDLNLLWLCDSKLNHLVLRDNITLKSLLYTTKMNSMVQTLQELQILVLLSTNIDENALVFTSKMQNLNKIRLKKVKMSIKTWRTFVDSLLSLKCSVRVETYFLDITDESGKIAAREYVGHNTAMCDLVYGGFYFSFIAHQQ